VTQLQLQYDPQYDTLLSAYSSTHETDGTILKLTEMKRTRRFVNCIFIHTNSVSSKKTISEQCWYSSNERNVDTAHTAEFNFTSCICSQCYFRCIARSSLVESFIEVRNCCCLRNCRSKVETTIHRNNPLAQWYSTWGTRTPGGTRRLLRGYVIFLKNKYIIL
jgi:hypothetical protein